MQTERLHGPRSRRAVVTSLDGPSAVSVQDVDPTSQPERSGTVVVRVAYAGVSMPDVLMSKGEYQTRHPLPFVPGREFSGVVERSSPTGPPLGSRVAGLVSHGAFADTIEVDPSALLPVPDALPLEVAACLPVNYLTTHYALLGRGRLAEGERVLVRGAGGGVGTAAVEIARTAGAGEVVAVASTPSKRDLASSLGADRAVADLGALSSDSSFDIVVDPVGGDDAIDAVRRLRQHGRYLIVGFTSGVIPSIAFNRILLRNIDVVGIYLGFRREVAPEEITASWASLCALAVDGRIAPAIDSVHPLESAADAMGIIEKREARGKVLLRLHGG